jgi:transcription initiation factor TFIID TATA-box-binding protein
MRKRKYGHRVNSNRVEDVMTEDIDDFYTTQTPVDPDMPIANIHNLVGTARIKASVQPFDLQHISRLLPNANWDKQKFAAITILTGCRNFMACVLASHEIVRMLRRGIPGVQFRLMDVHIQNIVGNATLDLKNQYIDLDAIYEAHNVYCTYQRNMFPGLIYRPNSSPVVLLIFISGKIVITGGKSSHDVKDGWRQLWPFVKQYVRDVV